MARSWRTSWAEGRGEATSDRVGDGQKARTSSKDFWPAWGHFPENRLIGKWTGGVRRRRPNGSKATHRPRSPPHTLGEMVQVWAPHLRAASSNITTDIDP